MTAKVRLMEMWIRILAEFWRNFSKMSTECFKILKHVSQVNS